MAENRDYEGIKYTSFESRGGSGVTPAALREFKRLRENPTIDQARKVVEANGGDPRKNFGQQFNEVFAQVQRANTDERFREIDEGVKKALREQAGGRKQMSEDADKAEGKPARGLGRKVLSGAGKGGALAAGLAFLYDQIMPAEYDFEAGPQTAAGTPLFAGATPGIAPPAAQAPAVGSDLFDVARGGMAAAQPRPTPMNMPDFSQIRLPEMTTVARPELSQGGAADQTEVREAMQAARPQQVSRDDVRERPGLFGAFDSDVATRDDFFAALAALGSAASGRNIGEALANPVTNFEDYRRGSAEAEFADMVRQEQERQQAAQAYMAMVEQFRREEQRRMDASTDRANQLAISGFEQDSANARAQFGAGAGMAEVQANLLRDLARVQAEGNQRAELQRAAQAGDMAGRAFDAGANERLQTLRGDQAMELERLRQGLAQTPGADPTTVQFLTQFVANNQGAENALAGIGVTLDQLAALPIDQARFTLARALSQSSPEPSRFMRFFGGEDPDSIRAGQALFGSLPAQ